MTTAGFDLKTTCRFRVIFSKFLKFQENVKVPAGGQASLSSNIYGHLYYRRVMCQNDNNFRTAKNDMKTRQRQDVKSQLFQTVNKGMIWISVKRFQGLVTIRYNVRKSKACRMAHSAGRMLEGQQGLRSKFCGRLHVKKRARMNTTFPGSLRKTCGSASDLGRISAENKFSWFKHPDLGGHMSKLTIMHIDATWPGHDLA